MSIKLLGETYLTTGEAASESGRTRNTVYCKYKQWGWKAYQFGANILFKQSDIHNWLSEQIKPKLAC